MIAGPFRAPGLADLGLLQPSGSDDRAPEHRNATRHSKRLAPGLEFLCACRDLRALKVNFESVVSAGLGLG